MLCHSFVYFSLWHTSFQEVPPDHIFLCALLPMAHFTQEVPLYIPFCLYIIIYITFLVVFLPWFSPYGAHTSGHRHWHWHYHHDRQHSLVKAIIIFVCFSFSFVLFCFLFTSRNTSSVTEQYIGISSTLYCLGTNLQITKCLSLTLTHMSRPTPTCFLL